ncbi:MAG: RHS repeat domain-containing protein, partial [Bacteroidota bacterium]
EIDHPSGLLAAQKLSFYEPFVPCALESAYYPLQTSYSPIPSVSAGSSHIGYGEVTEASLSDSNLSGFGGSRIHNSDITRYTNGYTVYKYDWLYDRKTTLNDEYDEEQLAGIEDLPYAPYEELTWRRGNLISNHTFKHTGDGSFVKMNETVNDQGFNTILNKPWSRAIEGIKIIEEGAVRYHRYYNVVTGANRVNKTIATQYENGRALSSTTDYYYGDNFLRPNRITAENSQGNVLSNITKYADEVDDLDSLEEAQKDVLRAMVDKNMVNVPIMETLHSNLTMLSNNLTIYSANGTKFQPTSIRQLNRKTSEFEEKVSFTYTSQHNYAQIVQPDGLTTTYLWSYKNSLPVAKIVNATYQQVSNVLGADLSNIESGNLSDQVIRTLLSPLRASLPDAQVEIYTYKAGVGTTSVSDPNGRVTTYFYDNYNRLESIRDTEGKLLQSIKYNYRNSQ